MLPVRELPDRSKRRRRWRPPSAAGIVPTYITGRVRVQSYAHIIHTYTHIHYTYTLIALSLTGQLVILQLQHNEVLQVSQRLGDLALEAVVVQVQVLQMDQLPHTRWDRSWKMIWNMNKTQIINSNS